MSDERAFLWQRIDGDGVEWCRVVRNGRRVEAHGVALGTEPLHYRCDYSVETEADGAARAVHVRTEGAAWSRTLSLHRHPDGRWDGSFSTHGVPRPELDGPCGDLTPLNGVPDVDVAFSPLSNSLPVLRLDLLDAEPGQEHNLLVLAVDVPSLAVRPVRQTYTALGPRGVRFASAGFTADLDLDGDGFVEHYPQLARRV